MPFNAMILKPSFYFETMKLEKEILNNCNPNKKHKTKVELSGLNPTAHPQLTHTPGGSILNMPIKFHSEMLPMGSSQHLVPSW